MTLIPFSNSKKTGSGKSTVLTWASILLLIVLGAAGSVWFAWATAPHGIGIRTDSVAYLWTARNIAHGVGIGRLDGSGAFRPITHWPPFYPLVLAVFEATGIGVIDGARWVGIFCVGVSLLLNGFLIRRLSRSWPITLVGSLLVFVSPILAQTNLYAMSEPLYIVLTLAGFLLLDRCLERPSALALIGLGILTGLVLVTRYVGVAFAVTAGIALIGVNPRLWAKRIRSAVIFTGIAILPLAVWLVRNLLVAGTATNRLFSYHPLQGDEGYRVYQMVYSWFSPLKALARPTPLFLILLAACLLIGGVLAFCSRRGIFLFPQSRLSTSANHLAVIVLVYCLVYLSVVFASRLFFDETIPLYENRIFAPFWLGMLDLALVVVDWLWNKAIQRKPVLPVIFILLMCSLLTSAFLQIFGQQTAKAYSQQNLQGSGLAQIYQSDSPILDQVKQIPDSCTLYTDNIESLYFLTGRYAWQLIDLDDDTQTRIRSDLQTGGAAIILMNANPDLIRQVQDAFPQLTPTGPCDASCVLR